MNTCIYEGRITNERLELKETNNGTEVLNFSLAVRKRKQGDEGTTDCDFLPCVAYGTIAVLIAKYSGKGCRILVKGRNTSNQYTDKDTGKKVYKTIMLLEEAPTFIEYANAKEEPVATNTVEVLSEAPKHESAFGVDVEELNNI